jgi:hypothetical protein
MMRLDKIKTGIACRPDWGCRPYVLNPSILDLFSYTNQFLENGFTSANRCILSIILHPAKTTTVAGMVGAMYILSHWLFCFRKRILGTNRKRIQDTAIL